MHTRVNVIIIWNVVALRKACHRHEDSFKVGLHRTIYKCHVGIQTHAHTHILELQTATNVAVSPFQGSSVQCVYITRNSNTAHSHTHFRFNHENIVCAHTKWYTGALLLCSGFQKSRFSHSGIPVPHRHPRATQAPPVPHRHPWDWCHTKTLASCMHLIQCTGHDILMQTNNQFQAMS